MDEPVGNDVDGALQSCQERLGLRTVTIVTRCRMDAYWQADRIHDRMQFGGQPAARAANSGSFSPPFTLVASAWTFEMVLSIIKY
jgi:hypothetical protein